MSRIRVEELEDYSTGDVIRVAEIGTLWDMNNVKEDVYANRKVLEGTYTVFVRSETNQPLVGVKCSVYVGTSNTLATGLQDDAGNPIPNPFYSGERGIVQFKASPGQYELRIGEDGDIVQTHSVFFVEDLRADLANPQSGDVLIDCGTY